MQSVKKVASIALSVVMWIIILVAALYAFTTLATREDGSVSDIAGFTRSPCSPTPWLPRLTRATSLHQKV